MLLLSLDGWLDKLLLQPVVLSLSLIQLAVAETNQAVKLCEAQELQACRCWFYSPPCPSLKGNTCMTAWMIKSCSEWVRTGGDERHYQCSSSQTWHSRGVQSFTKPGTTGFAESLILLNEESALNNRCSLLQGRREVKGGNLLFQGVWQPHILTPNLNHRHNPHEPTEMLQDLVIKALSRALKQLVFVVCKNRSKSAPLGS